MKKLIRIIPNLLIKDNYLVKGKQFKDHKYVGDIFNAVKIFSEKKVHEIQILDISARKKSKCIDFNLIAKIRTEIFVPLAVGGGIKDIDQVSAIINEGVEKIIINSENFNNMNLLNKIAKKFGSQSAVVSIDVKKIESDKVFKVPHMGWNKVNTKNNDLFRDIENMTRFYFCHSYHFSSNDKNLKVNLTNYKFDICAAFNYQNIYGVQFHPEKSYTEGSKLINNFYYIS